MDKETLKKLKEKYKKGTRVKLIKMDDASAPKVGSIGTILDVDDIGSIIVCWENGQVLNVLFGIDEVMILD